MKELILIWCMWEGPEGGMHPQPVEGSVAQTCQDEQGQYHRQWIDEGNINPLNAADLMATTDAVWTHYAVTEGIAYEANSLLKNIVPTVEGTVGLVGAKLIINDAIRYHAKSAEECTQNIRTVNWINGGILGMGILSILSGGSTLPAFAGFVVGSEVSDQITRKDTAKSCRRRNRGRLFAFDYRSARAINRNNR